MPGYMGACKGKAGMKARYCAAEISGRKDPRCGDMRQYSALACRAVLSLSRRGEPDAHIIKSNEVSEGAIAVLDYISSEIRVFCHPVYAVVFTGGGVVVFVRDYRCVALKLLNRRVFNYSHSGVRGWLLKYGRLLLDFFKEYFTNYCSESQTSVKVNPTNPFSSIFFLNSSETKISAASARVRISPKHQPYCHIQL